jgi:D-threo-aldose 1-dehydrogenase
MRTVALPGTDLAPSRLAFGSALLMGKLGRRESLRLLEVAHESGITHFDTARAYGYGEAESALGEFLSGRRDAVTVTTKLGIAPPPGSRGLHVAKSLGRAAARGAPVLRRFMRRGAEMLSHGGRFDPPDARRSLEASLRELRTDHVDVLLLHECRPADLETEGLLDFLQEAVREGKVRYFGVATDSESTRAILSDRPQFAQVAQFANNAVAPTLEQLPPLGNTAVITHSAVGEPLERLTGLLHDPHRRERWSQALGVDPSRPELVGRLLLAYALHSNADGVVLFASTDPERIASNAALADAPEFSAEQIGEFARLAQEAIAGR